MSRMVSPLIGAIIASIGLALSSEPAVSHQLPIPGGIPGLNSSALGGAETFFNQAVSKASPKTMDKINELVGLFKSGAQNGQLTDGTSQVKNEFPHANTEQQAVLRTTGFAGALTQLGSAGLEKLGGSNVHSLISGFSQSQTSMNNILHKTNDTPSSVISHL